MTSRAHLVLLGVVAAACATAPLLILAGVHGFVPGAATAAVLGLAPGTAMLGAARRRAPLELGLVLGTSLGCSTVTAQAMLALGVWSPRAATCALALVCLPFVTLRIYTLSRPGHPAASELRP
jgi:hypothetical protein